MKKKLLFWEAVMIVLIIGAFLIIFSIKNGWELTGAERYSIAVVAGAVAFGVGVGAAAVCTSNDKKLKNPFTIIFLTLEGFVIFGMISVIIFLL